MMSEDKNNKDSPVQPSTGDEENQQVREDPSSDAPASKAGATSWWSRNRVLAVSVGLIVVALTIGLSVGFTTGKHKNRGSASSSTTATTTQNQNQGGNTSTGTTQNQNQNQGGNSSTGTTQNQNQNQNQGGNTSTGTTPAEPGPSFASATLPSFGEQVLVPYSSCDSFVSDLTKAVERLVNTSIDANAQWYYHSNFTYGGCIDCHFGQPMMEATAAGGDTSNAAPVTGGASPSHGTSASGVSSFGTNNQVDGVDEADAVKSNGIYVFSVYGSEIVVVDAANTTLLSRTTIPSPNISIFYPDVNFSALNSTSSSTTTTTSTSSVDSTGSSGGSSGSNETTSSSGSNETASSNFSSGNGTSGGNGTSSPGLGTADPTPPYFPTFNWNCWSSINSLLLTGERLVVLASQGCWYYAENYTAPQRTLSSGDSTVVFIYDISSVPKDGKSPLTLIGQSSFQGYYSDARSIGSIAYLVTNSYIDTYTNLLNKVDIYSLASNNPNLTETQYRDEAYDAAKIVIPAYVQQLLGELENATGTTSCDNLIRLTLLQTSQRNSSAEEQQLGFTGNGILSTLTLVTSFNVDQVTGTSFVKSTAGLFQPTGWSTIYANKNRLVVAGQGWSERLNGGWWEETYLLVFRLDGTSVRADAVAQVPGYTIDQFSLDIAEDNEIVQLRVASRSSAQWGLVDGYWNQTSESTNQVYVLQFPADGSANRVLSVVGSITNISVSETLQSVRFFGDKAFISTFKYTDPFFTIDLSTPSAPRLVGELKVTGFSSYLQPIANGTQILAIGQDANATTGWVTGLKISLFDVADLSNPRLLQSYTVPNNNNGWSSSEAQYDHKAFRYLEEPKLLIIPVAVNDYISFNNSFDGFVVYNIDPTVGISPSFTIEHADNYAIRFGCWSSSYLTARSLVFTGNVLTQKGHTFQLHNLDSHQLIGSVLDLDENVNKTNNCVPYYFF